MHMTRSPVDELAAVRAKISLLRARESALEAQFLETNDVGRFAGYTVDVVVERTMHEVFDIAKLPDAVLNDPRYYAQKLTTRISIEDREVTPHMPGHMSQHDENWDSVIDADDAPELLNIFAAE